EDLVCRLLLEKKNAISTRSTTIFWRFAARPQPPASCARSAWRCSQRKSAKARTCGTDFTSSRTISQNSESSSATGGRQRTRSGSASPSKHGNVAMPSPAFNAARRLVRLLLGALIFEFAAARANQRGREDWPLLLLRR